jgi:hypothetical protein
MDISRCPVRDISPLKGLPLTDLLMSECKEVHDLTPLAGMKLVLVHLPPDVTKGLESIRAMKSLQNIDGTPPRQFWKLWGAAKAKAQ